MRIAQLLALAIGLATFDDARAGQSAPTTLPLQTFEALCAAHPADRAGVLKAAGEGAWEVLPDNVFPREGGLYERMRFLHISDFSVRRKHSEAGDMVLLVGRDKGAGDLCVVAAHADYQDTLRQMHDWLGMNRFETWGPGGEFFMFVTDGEKRTPAQSIGKADLMVAARRRAVSTSGVIGDQDSVMLVYGVPNLGG